MEIILIIFFSMMGVIFILCYCEYLIYYFVQSKCDWPVIDFKFEDQMEETLKVMVIADTHLLGSRRGHWFDKLRREWQMYRAFQTAVYLHQPEVIFVLGDLTDEGLFCSNDEFNYYVKRFNSLFSVPEETQMYVVAGNHDIGFHYEMRFKSHTRFRKSFNASDVRLISIKGIYFVLINSMALEGDGCSLCRHAEKQLTKISTTLRCLEENSYFCGKDFENASYSKPIIMQHFPLYRRSDEECNEYDSAPMPLKKEKFKQAYDCLSKESTTQLLQQIKPRVVMSGHTHHGCVRKLDIGRGYEYTIPSFSWRNKNNPSYSLLIFTKNRYGVSKCLMPTESTVITLYTLAIAIILGWLILARSISLKRTFVSRRKIHKW